MSAVDPSVRPIVELLRAVYWTGRCDTPSYRGKRGYSEEPFLSLPVPIEVSGIAPHPDGRVALAEGRGSTSEGLRLAFWSERGPGEVVAAIGYAAEAEGPNRPEIEQRGRYWSFAGPLAFDRRGSALFSLGPGAPNGIYRVESRQPLRVERLYEMGRGSSMLQVPPFDAEHAYVIYFDRVLRYSLERPEAPVIWFGLPGVYLHDAVLLSATEAVVQLSGGQDPIYGTFYFDNKARAFWSLSEQNLGPMALAWDGKGLIRYDRGSRSLRRFSIAGR